MRLADLVNRHAGETVTVFGTGPSLDDFDLEALAGPRILLNRCAFALPASAGETYWLVADDAWANGTPGPWFEHLADVVDGDAQMVGVFRDPLMTAAGPGATRRGPNIVTWRGDFRPREALLTMDRDALAEAGQLYAHCGTAAPAVHLAWLMGAAGVRLVGVDGTDGHADLLAHYYTDRPRKGGLGYMTARGDAELVAERLKIDAEFFTPPDKPPDKPKDHP